MNDNELIEALRAEHAEQKASDLVRIGADRIQALHWRVALLQHSLVLEIRGNKDCSTICDPALWDNPSCICARDARLLLQDIEDVSFGPAGSKNRRRH